MPAPAATRPQTVTIRGVELVRAGTWDASTGRITIAPEQLDDIVAAAADPEVDRAPVKIGHTGAWSTLGDSAPSLGWVANIRREGDVVVGDLVDVPARLAAIMPKAFRRRSVELLANVKTPGGKTYRLALTGLALLGVQAPAVKGLADLLALYDAPERPIAAADRPETLPELVELDVVEGAVDAELAGVIATAATALAGSVTAGEATQEAADAILDRIFATAGVPDATIHPDPATPGDTSGDDPTGTNGGTMPVDEARIRELLGIEADADVEATITDLRTRAERAPDGDGNGNGDGNGDGGSGDGNGNGGEGDGGTTTTTPPTPEDVAQRVAAAGATVNPDGTVVLSAGSFAALLDGVEQGRSAAQVLDQQARDRALDDAVRSGRITPDERAHFAASYAQRPATELVAFLGGLAQRFPVVELGSAGATEDIADEAFDSFMADVFGPELTGGK